MKTISRKSLSLLLLLVLGCAGLVQAGAGQDVLVTSNITTSETWTQDNIYILTTVIYVTNGATLTIEPGTVIRGEPESAPGANDPGTLVITRGSKIRALGTARQPIVFTNLDDDNIGSNPGTSPYDNAADARGITGTWGGVILLGRSYVANNTLAGPNAAREVQIEGLSPAGGLGLYGDCMNQGAFPDCDDDDSGVVRYTSIRYGGFNLSANNEINGLTLAAVGRETDLDHIEVFQNKDDGVEFFGGTAEVKHLVVYAVGDDSVDYDEGFRGKIQFGFIVQGLPGSDRSDKGAEQDGGNNPDGSRPLAIPTFYNMTFIGHDGEKNFTGSDLNSALHFRDNAGVRQYNSFYADFGGAPILIEGGNLPGGSQTAVNSSGERAITPYPGTIDPEFLTGPPSAFQLELEDNTFWCMGAGGVVPAGDATVWGGDAGKNHYDNDAFDNPALDNDYLPCNAPLPIRELVRETNVPTLPDPVLTIDPRPLDDSALLTTDRFAPLDGFFGAANYRGAFSSSENWAAGWTNGAHLGLYAKCDPIAHPNAIPNPARQMAWPDKDTLTWLAPLGEDFSSFDVLRVVGTNSSAAADFSSALCLESGDADLDVELPETPAMGEVHFLIVRVNNGCGDNAGTDSGGTPRVGPVCP